MKVTLKKLPQSEVELTITVPYEVYLKCEVKALEALSSEIKVDGFRKGHIPPDVVRERVGEAGVRSAALEFLLPETYSKAVKEEKLEVIAAPKVEIKSPIKKAGDELVYTARVAVMPAVTVGNYKKIKVKRAKPVVTAEQVTDTLTMILERFAQWKDVQREAKTGDRVELNFEAFEPETKAPIPNTASKNHPVVLGSKVMVPGFEEAIPGMAVGSTKEFDLTFPKTYHATELQGKTVQFKVTLNRVEEKIPQALDEAFVEKVTTATAGSSTGVKQSIDEFKKRVESDLLTEMQDRLNAEHDSKVVSEIIKITQVDLPQALVDEEVAAMKEEQKKQASRQGLSWEQYLQHLKKTDEDFTRDHATPAQERLKARLGVQHIMRDAKITPDQLIAMLSE